MIDCTASMSESRLLYVRHGDLALFGGVAVDRLLIGGFRLIGRALTFMQGIRHLVEPRLRRVALLGQLADTVVGLLRQDHARLRPLQCRLARRDDFRPRARIDVGKLGVGYGLGRHRLLALGDVFGIVDPHQHRSGRDVLSARHRNVGDPPVDARGDVEPRRIDFALDQQRLRAHEKPDRESGDGRDDDAYDDGGDPAGARRLVARCRLPRRRARWRRWGGLQHIRGLGVGTRRLHSSTPRGAGEARHVEAPEDPRPERYDRVEIRASALEAIDVIVMRLGGLMRLGGATLAERGLMHWGACTASWRERKRGSSHSTSLPSVGVRVTD